MTSQAQNCLSLYRGGNPSTIKALLKIGSKSVLKELQEHFDTTDIDILAQRLSLGK